MHVSHAGRDLGRPARRDVRLILAYLLLHRGQEVARDVVAAAVWPQADDQVALARLRRGVHRVLSDLPQAPGEPWITRTRQTLQWNSRAEYSLDLDEVESLWRRSLRPAGHDPGRVREDLARLTELMRGDLLEGDDEEWIESDRARCTRRFGEAIDRLADSAERLGDTDTAIVAGRRLLEHEPLREDAHRRLMRLYHQGGDTSAALGQFERCREVLRAELGVAPHALTEALAATIRTGAPARGMAARSPAGDTPTAGTRTAGQPSAGGAPAAPLRLRAPDRFVGRHAELTEAARRLSHDRLVVLTGPPGCGKSRLALELATELGSDSRYRPQYVDLGACVTPDDVLRSASEAVTGRRDATLADVAAAMGDGRTLLVLDNCERVADGAAAVIGSLLWSTPGLRVLATSRSPIDQPAAAIWRIGGLEAKDAVSLFLDRAEHTGAALRVAGGTGAAVGAGAGLGYDAGVGSDAGASPGGSGPRTADIRAICERLACLPLAIELAAGHTAVLSPAEISLELDDLPRLLTAESPPGMARHRSMCQAVAASRDLIDDTDRRVLRRLCAVGPTTWPIAAVTGALPGGRWAALHALERLVEHSLVEVVPSAGVGTQYRVPEPVWACVRRAWSAEPTSL